MKKTAKIAAAFCAAGLLGLAAAHAEGNLRYSITVTKFANEAGWSGRWDVGDGFTTIMTDALQQKWIADAKARGIENPEKVLAEYTALATK